MSGSDTYQRNERNRREFQKVQEAEQASAAGRVQPAESSIPFLIGMGLGLGLNIVGYFAFKVYFRNVLEIVTSFGGRSSSSGSKMRSEGRAAAAAARQQYQRQQQQRHQQQQQQEPQQQTSQQRGSTAHESAGGSSAGAASQSRDASRTSLIRQHLVQLELPLSQMRPSVADIKSAYRRRSLKTHPDVARGGAGAGQASREELQRRFMLATTAHDELLRCLHGR